MITSLEKFEKLKDDINEINGLCYFGNTDLITLCPKCERDRYKTSRNHGHLYISKTEPIFRCFRCDYKGIIPFILNEYKLNMGDYFDSDLLKMNWSKTSVDKFHNKEINSDIIIKDNTAKDEDYNKDNKINYLNNRIYKFEEIDKSNIIFDIKSFLEYNNVQHQIKDNLLQYINSNFIGFLCTRRSTLVCRNIDPESKFRYYNINLKKIFFKDFYSKELNKDSNNILLCEGIFDLLNIINNDKLQSFLNNFRIISSALNNNYVHSLISTLDYVKIPYANNVIVFSDKDVIEEDYMNLYFNNSFNNLTLYYNELDKDFSSKNISLIKVPIKKYIKRKPIYNAKEKENIRI